MKDILEYNAVNLKTPVIVFYLILFFGISAFAFWGLITTNGSVWVLWLPILFFPLIIFYSITTKIILTSDSIIKKTFFRIRELKYCDIKSFGMYEQAGRMGYLIDEKDLNKTDYFSQKFGFVSIQADYSPNSFKQKGTIRFHLSGSDIYEKLKERLQNAGCQQAF